MRIVEDISELYNHISIEHVLRCFRLNTLIPKYQEILDRLTSICLKNNYNSIDNIILVMDKDLIKRHYYLEEFNKNIYLISQPVKELNQFLKRIMIKDSAIANYPEEYEEIKRYSKITGVPIEVFEIT